MRPWQDVLVELAAVQIPGVCESRRHGASSRLHRFHRRYDIAPGIGFLAPVFAAEWRKVLPRRPKPEAVGPYMRAKFLRPKHWPPKPTVDARRQSRLSRGCRRRRFTRAEADHPQIGPSHCRNSRLTGGNTRVPGQSAISTSDSRAISIHCQPGMRRALRRRRGYRTLPTRAGIRCTPSPAPDGDVSLRDSQNAWLRQIVAQNYLYMNNTATGCWAGRRRLGVGGVGARPHPLADENDGVAARTPSGPGTPSAR